MLQTSPKPIKASHWLQWAWYQDQIQLLFSFNVYTASDGKHVSFQSLSQNEAQKYPNQNYLL